MLYYVHSLVIYGASERPRINLMTRRMSDIANIGTPVIWTAQVLIRQPLANSPRAHFQAALEQLPDLTTLEEGRPVHGKS